MKKKIISMLLVACMGLSLVACGGGSNTPASNDGGTTEEGNEGAQASDEGGSDENASNEGSDEGGSSGDVITVGFSQVGAESDWRTANSESMKSTFSEANGYKLIFDDAQQKQENQLTAIRNFINQEVDYIVLAPTTETGWDTVLQEAKDAGIPVIIVDRMVDVSDDTLYNCYVGASAQIGRTEGLEEAAEKYGWNIVAQQSGEFTQAKGQEVMESMLKSNDNINVVYCENDNEAFGAIDAIKAAGKTVGPDGDILVMSFDTVKAGIEMTMAGDIICNTECNPLHGPRVEELIKQMEAGEEPEKIAYVDEGIFTYGDEVAKVTVDGQDYEVTKVTQEVIDGRMY